MVRPDQARFYQFSRHLELVDEELYRFSTRHSLEIEKNPQRQPSRVLRLTEDPGRLLSVHLDGYWLKMTYEADLPHGVASIAYLTKASGAARVDRATLEKHRPFSVVRANLYEFLSTGLDFLRSVPPAMETTPVQQDPERRLKELTETALGLLGTRTESDHGVWGAAADGLMQLTGVQESDAELVRMVENYGRRGRSQVQYMLGLQPFLVDTPSSWQGWPVRYWLSSPRDSISPLQVEIGVDERIGCLRTLEITLRFPSFVTIDRPPVAARREEGVPVFDLSFWPSHATERCGGIDPSAGWIGSNELYVHLAPGTATTSLECVVAPTLSLFFEEDGRLTGVLIRSLSNVDRLVIRQASVEAG